MLVVWPLNVTVPVLAAEDEVADALVDEGEVDEVELDVDEHAASATVLRARTALYLFFNSLLRYLQWV
jgi:hypothetical protein